MSLTSMEDLIKELISARFPHLKGMLTVRISSRSLFYEVSKGRAGLLIEVGAETLTHSRRREIFVRMGSAAQDVHAGLTHASRVTGLNEVQS